MEKFVTDYRWFFFGYAVTDFLLDVLGILGVFP